MVLSNQCIWQKYIRGLLNLVKMDGFDSQNQVLCISKEPITLDLTGDNSIVSNYDVYLLGNSVPKYSPVYEPLAELSVSFSTFLTYIDPFDGTVSSYRKGLNTAANELCTADRALRDEFNYLLHGYQTMKGIFPALSLNEYIRAYGQSFSAAYKTYARLKNRYDRILMDVKKEGRFRLSMARNRVSPLDKGARFLLKKNFFNMSASSERLPRISGKNGFAPYYYHGNPMLQLFLPAFKLRGFDEAYHNWQTFKTEEKWSAVLIEINNRNRPAALSELGWNMAVSPALLGLFISVFGLNGNPEHSIKQEYSAKGFNIRISFTGFSLFEITPGEWFQPEILSKYRNSLLKDAPYLFGENGELSLLPEKIIVGFEPALKISFNRNDYQEIKGIFSSQGCRALKIGPFLLGNSAKPVCMRKEDVHFDDEKCSISAGPLRSGPPVVLGVICKKL